MLTVWTEKGCEHLFTLGCEIQPRTKAAAPSAGLLIGFWVFAKGKAPYAFCHFFPTTEQSAYDWIRMKQKRLNLKVFSFTNPLGTGVRLRHTPEATVWAISEQVKETSAGNQAVWGAEFAPEGGLSCWWNISQCTRSTQQPSDGLTQWILRGWGEAWLRDGGKH